MLKAILLDFDGVIADTEPIHFKMFAKILAEEEGIRLLWKDYCERYLGYDDHDCFKAVLRNLGTRTYFRGNRYVSPDSTIINLTRKKTRLMKDYFRSHPVLLKGVKPWLKRMAGRYPLVIVSGALRSEIEIVLKRGGIFKYFSEKGDRPLLNRLLLRPKKGPVPFSGGIISAEDVEKGKPHPEGFLKGLGLLNRKRREKILPSECLVVEDSMWGIKAAKRAGMKCVALTTSYPASKLKKADSHATSLRAIALPL